MGKSPKMQHSKAPQRGPLTIEGDAGKAAPTPSADSAKADADKTTSASPVQPPKSSSPGVGLGGASAAVPPRDRPAGSTPSVMRTDKPSLDATPGDRKPSDSEPPKSPSERPAFGRSSDPATPRTDPKPAAPVPPVAAAPPPRRGGGASALVAGLLGGVVAIGLVAGLQYAGLLPSMKTGEDASVAALRGEIEALRQQVAEAPRPDVAPIGELGQRVEALQSALDEARSEVSALASRAGAEGSPEAMQALDQRFSALEAAVAALPQAAAGATVDLAPLNGRIEALEQRAGQTAQAGEEAVARLAGRLDAIEKTVAGLSGKVEEQSARPDAALAIAASALKAAVDRGEPFTAELDTYLSVAPDAAAVEPLKATAATGVASRAAIAAAFQDAAPRMIDAARTRDPQAGLFSQLMDSAQSLVQVRPVGTVEGSDAPAVVARIEGAIGDGNYAKALSEFEALPAASREAGAELAAMLRARLAADEVTAQVVASALRS